jgi:DUF1009 family protein
VEARIIAIEGITSTNEIFRRQQRSSENKRAQQTTGPLKKNISLSKLRSDEEIAARVRYL